MPKPLRVQGSPFIYGIMNRKVFDPVASRMIHVSAAIASNSSALHLVKPHFLETWIFWQPGNLNQALCRTSTMLLVLQLGVTDLMTWKMWTLVTVPWSFLKTPEYLSEALPGDNMKSDINVHWKAWSLGSLRAVYASNRLHILLRRLLFAAFASHHFLNYVFDDQES